MDIVGSIMDFEAGTLDDNSTLELFGELVRSGMVWDLQGSYGRTATAMIDAGLISETGEVLV